MVFGGAFGAGVAAYADALFAAANPEPAVLLANYFAFLIEEGEADGFVGGGLHEEGTVGLDGGGADCDGMALGVEGLEADLRGGDFQIAFAGLAGIEGEQIGVGPIVKAGRMALGARARGDDNWID